MDTTKTITESNIAGSGLTQMMRRHPLVSFFVLAYAISWILSIPVVLAEWRSLPYAVFFFFFTIKSFGPAAAAYIMIRMMDGKAGLQVFRQRFFLRRVGWQWYLIVLLGIPAVMLLGALALPGVAASFQGLKPAFFGVNYLITFVLIFFGGGALGEEPGWRGFALPRMQTRYGALRANLLLGVMWTLWHLPDSLTSAQGGGPGAGLSPLYTRLPIFFGMVMGLTFVFSWVFNHTGGSIWMALLLHASFNTFGGAAQPLFSAPIMTSSDLPFLIGVVVLAVLIIVLTRGQIGYRPGQAEAAQ